MSLVPRPSRPLAAILTALATVAMLLAGCTGGTDTDQAPSGTTPASDESTPSDDPTSSGTSTAAPEPPDSEMALPEDDPTTTVPFPADLQPDTAEASGDAQLSPSGFRTGVHDDFDRVVVDFSGSGTPGWRAQYTDSPVEQGSGLPVDLLGGAALRMEIHGVTSPTANAGAWSGPENLTPQSTGTIEQVVRGPLFEGTLQIFLGLTEQEPFRVFALDSPTRLVIDVYHSRSEVDEGALPDDEPTANAPFPANRKPDREAPSADAQLSPADLRFGVHDGFDRIVLNLTGSGTPGWLGEYVAEPALAGSGAPVEIKGKSGLQVSVTGVVYPTEPGAEQYTGPQRFRPIRAGNVQEVVYGAIFEGQLEIYVGVKSEQPFRVFQIDDPTRVVIDVQHP